MLESGQELSARFVLARRIGVGGSGAVWLAQDRVLSRFVALKVLAPEWSSNSAAVTLLQREYERIRALDHENILRVDALHRAGPHVWIAMEYASGGDLSQWRGRGVIEIVRALAPIARAVAAAHDAGVVHRDLKPANVLLMADGTPKLADFGMARSVAEHPGEHVGLGSPFSMSPQQWEGQAAAPADDIYAFGAMLYELLSGYPPFYPEATRARVLLERPAPLSVAGAPASVLHLIERCLAKTSRERPVDMKEVERHLNAVAAELPAPASVSTADMPPHIEPPSIRPPAAHGEPLRGEWRRTGAAASATAEELRRQGFRRGITAALLTLGIVGIGVVFFALPKWVGTDQPVTRTPATVATTSAAAQPAVEKEEIDFAALARAKQDAEEKRGALDERLQKLDARAVQQWGGATYPAVTTELAVADKEFEAREYIAASQRFDAVGELLAALEQQAPEVLKKQLAAGGEALLAGRSADARTAFELATKIDPANQVAIRGLKRASTLDQVLGLVAQAERSERESNLTAAAENFRKALALDAEAPRAAEGLARVQARIAGDAFASAMARGFAALANAEYGAARSAFEAAGKVRPNAPEVAQAINQVVQEQRTRIIAGKLESARGHESNERWSEALQEYRAVLELDGTVAAASEGVARTTPRAVLNEQLELYLTQPERLFSQPVRLAARETLNRAGMIATPGPVLQQQTAKLSDWLKRADVPVRVALQSDNFTQVTVYRVGALGHFIEHSLELAPGTYTVVGTRPGYRDVRREINVTPDAQLPPIVIRCEDKI